MTYLKNARLVIINSEWGHMCTFVGLDCFEWPAHTPRSAAGGGSNVQDDEFIQAEVKKFLEEP